MESECNENIWHESGYMKNKRSPWEDKVNSRFKKKLFGSSLKSVCLTVCMKGEKGD